MTTQAAVALRTANISRRPLLRDDPEAWGRILEARRPLYEEVADITFRTDRATKEQLSLRVIEWARARGRRDARRAAAQQAAQQAQSQEATGSKHVENQTEATTEIRDRRERVRDHRRAGLIRHGGRRAWRPCAQGAHRGHPQRSAASPKNCGPSCTITTGRCCSQRCSMPRLRSASKLRRSAGDHGSGRLHEKRCGYRPRRRCGHRSRRVRRRDLAARGAPRADSDHRGRHGRCGSRRQDWHQHLRGQESGRPLLLRAERRDLRPRPARHSAPKRDSRGLRRGREVRLHR